MSVVEYTYPHQPLSRYHTIEFNDHCNDHDLTHVDVGRCRPRWRRRDDCSWRTICRFRTRGPGRHYGFKCRSRGSPVPALLLSKGQYPRLNARSQPAAGQLERTSGTRHRGSGGFLRQPGKEPEVRRKERSSVPPTQRPQPRTGKGRWGRTCLDPACQAYFVSRGGGWDCVGGIPRRQTVDACARSLGRLPRNDRKG